MKWLLMLVLLSTQALSADGQSVPQLAKAAATDWAQGRMTSLVSRMDPKFKPDLRNEAHERSVYFLDAGVFQSADDAICTPGSDEDFQDCSVTVHFSKHSYLLKLEVRPDGRIGSHYAESVDGEDWVAWMQREHPAPDLPGPAAIIALTSVPLWVFKYLVPLCLSALTWAALHFFPLMRKDAFFGIPTDPSFPASAEGVDILRSYRRRNLALGILGVLLILAGHYWTSPYASFLWSAQIFGASIIAILASRRIWPHRLTGEPERTASLAPASPLSEWMWALLAVPILVLAATTWYLLAQRHGFPVGHDGQVVAWKIQAYKNAAGFLSMGWSALLAFYAPAALVVWGSRRNATETLLVRPYLIAHAGIMIGLACTTALLSVDFLWIPSRMVPEAMFLVVPAMVGAAMMPMWRVMRKSSPGPDTTPRECWRARIFYVNPADSAWMVRIGYCYVPNYGHLWIRGVMSLMLVQFAGVWIYLLQTG